jgi:hypothetical protein
MLRNCLLSLSIDRAVDYLPFHLEAIVPSSMPSGGTDNGAINNCIYWRREAEMANVVNIACGRKVFRTRVAKNIGIIQEYLQKQYE